MSRFSFESWGPVVLVVVAGFGAFAAFQSAVALNAEHAEHAELLELRAFVDDKVCMAKTDDCTLWCATPKTVSVYQHDTPTQGSSGLRTGERSSLWCAGRRHIFECSASGLQAIEVKETPAP